MSTSVQLSSYLREQEFVAFDTETTGLWAPTNRIVEIGAVKFSLGHTSTTEFQTLINPDRPMPEEVIKIHGITDTMVLKSPKIESVLPDFISFCGDAILVAHNSPFDISFIVAEAERSEIVLPNNPVIDTVGIFRKYFTGLKSYSLLSLAREYNLATDQSHRALDDARLVQMLLGHASGKFAKIDKLDILMQTLSACRLSEWKTSVVVFPPPYEELQRALKDQLRITISYRRADQSADEPEDNRTIKLRQAYQLGSRYYLSAFCEKVGAERTFRLDRIKDFTLLDD